MRPHAAPVLPWFCLHMLLGRSTGGNDAAWAGTAPRVEASSSNLPSSRVLEEPRRRGPITQKLLRNLKQKRDGLSCAAARGGQGDGDRGAPVGVPQPAGAFAQPQPATGRSMASPAFRWCGSAIPRPPPPTPSEVSEIRSSWQGAKVASMHGVRAVRRNLFSPRSVISPPCAAPSPESAEE